MSRPYLLFSGESRCSVDYNDLTRLSMINVQSELRHTYQETDNVINISTHIEKNWMQFFLAVFSTITLVAIAVYIIVSVAGLLMQRYASEDFKGFIFLLRCFSFVALGLLLGSIQAIDNAFLQEDIEITHFAITIVKSGFLLFRKKQVISANKIRGIYTNVVLPAENDRLDDALINASKIGKLIIRVRRKYFPIVKICRGMSSHEAKVILEKILVKFPQYQFRAR